MKKDLIYLALAIGGGFLLYKYYMKKTSTPGDLVSTPVEPSIPGVINQEVIKTLVNNDIASSITNEVSSEYEVANTYQNYYAKQINGTNKKIPNII